MDFVKVMSYRVLVRSVCVLLICCHLPPVSCQDFDEVQATELPTVTVRGFLNFKTTVDGTVIVFTPAAELPKTAENVQQPTKPIEKPTLSTNLILHGNVLESKEAAPLDIQNIDYSQPVTLTESLHSDIGDLAHLGHKVKAPFLQHISDNAVLPSTIQTGNDLETQSSRKDSSSFNHYPTGLVTVLEGTHIESGKTTIFETKVIGTYIDGKYAQILQSTSKIIAPTTFYTPSYISVGVVSRSSLTTSATEISSTVSKTLEPSSTIASSTPLPSPVSAVSETSSTTTLSRFSLSSSLPLPPSSLPLPPSSSPSLTLSSSPSLILPSSSSSSLPSPSSPSPPSVANTPSKTEISSSYSTGRTETPVLQSSFETTFSSSFSAEESTQSLDAVKTPSFKPSSPKIVSVSPTIRNSDDEDSLLLKSRNLRVSSTRIRFSAPRRPSPTVRLNRFKVKLTLRHNTTEDFTTPSEEEVTDSEEEIDEDEPRVSPTEADMLDLDPSQVVYQETTITSEVTLHVGRRKSVRTLTITTSVPMRISPTEDSHRPTMTSDPTEDHTVDEDPPTARSVVSRTFTTTERTYTTSVVPVFDGTHTTHHTLTESLFIVKIVTAYKTLPPTDYTVLATPPEQTESTQDAVVSLDVAANIQPSVVEALPQTQHTSTEKPEILQPSVPMLAVQSNMNNGIGNPLLSLGQALSNNPLAAVYLGLQQLNAQMTLYSTVTQTSTYLTTDTIYSTKVIRFYDGRSTRYRTISEPLSTKERTATTTVTRVQPYINTQAYQQQQQLQKLIAATQLPIPQQQQQFRTLTTTYTTETTATSLSTRIYTLIYNGFSTKFRTVTSTKVYPTTVTITSTKEVPVMTTQPHLLPFAYPYPAA